MIGDFLDNFKHARLADDQGSKDDRPLNFDRGKYIFGRDCVACHTIGRGDAIGPDLLNVTRIRSRQWLVRMIQTPDALLKEKDRVAVELLKKYNNVRMPNLGTSDLETDYLLRYIEEQSAARNHEAAAAGKIPEPANP